MLGELYKPSGLALETAKAVLEVDDPYAVNVAWDCLNKCSYCYVSKVARRKTVGMRLPKKPPVQLVRKQLMRMGKVPQGVFASFCTDPYLPENEKNTEDLVWMLRNYEVEVATLSKRGVSWRSGVRHGTTIVSFDDSFWKVHEPNALAPNLRLAMIRRRGYGWVSMEPYPPSAIHKQDINDFLSRFHNAGIKLIVFGKWNYDKRATTEQARQEYAECIGVLTDFCKAEDIRLHVKSDTLKFVNKAQIA